MTWGGTNISLTCIFNFISCCVDILLLRAKGVTINSYICYTILQHSTCKQHFSSVVSLPPLPLPLRFLSPNNQRVTDALIDQVYSDAGGLYTIKDIKRAVHRYYESRRRLGIEELPDRQEKAAEQRKKRKYRARQQRSYDRRRKFVREAEMRYWEHISPACMTEESDSEQGERIVTHQLMWRSDCKC